MGKMNVRRISEGLISAVGEVEGCCLSEVMDRHEFLGLLVPGIRCPCDYSIPGDDDDHLFIFAFLEVLRHHVNLGQIDGVHETDEKEGIWEQWRKGELKARRLRRPADSIDPSYEQILPRNFRIIAQTPLRLSECTWELLKAGEGQIAHLDYVTSPLFRNAAN